MESLFKKFMERLSKNKSDLYILISVLLFLLGIAFIMLGIRILSSNRILSVIFITVGFIILGFLLILGTISTPKSLSEKFRNYLSDLVPGMVSGVIVGIMFLISK